MNITQSIKKVFPARIKTLLRPYNGILKRHRIRTRLNNGICVTPNAEHLSKMRCFSMKYETRYLHAMLEKGWIHPGHMFDEIGEIFSANNKLFLVGTRKDVDRLTQRLGFIGGKIESLTLTSPQKSDAEYIASRTADGYTVIIGYRDAHVAKFLAEEICQNGYHFNDVNVFTEAVFLGDLISYQHVYCGIFSCYTRGKVYMTHNCVISTTICNLNCKNCLNYTPYIKNPKHFSFEELKKSIDTYFNHVDRVGLLQVSGGEPLLYPRLKELLAYIADNYREKIYVLNLVTNGTIVPDDDFILFCKGKNIFVYIDDYTDTVPRIKETFDAAYKKFRNGGVRCNPLKSENFIITIPPLKKNLNLTELELKKKYINCHAGIQNLRDGKICSCAFFVFAENAGLIKTSENDWFDLSAMRDDILDKRKLIEFRIGFNKKGYVEWCRYCNGHIAINDLSGPAGEQAKGRLDWDINAPTFLD